MKWKIYNYPRFYDWYMKKLAGWIEVYRERELLHVLDQCVANNNVILDIGCGTGTTCMLLGKRYQNARIVGIDINSDFLSYAEQKVSSSGIKNVTFIKQDIANCTGEDISKDQIDIAICTLGLSVFTDWEKAIEQTFSILRPGGDFIVFDLFIDTQTFTGRLSNFLTKSFFKAHHDRMILNKLRETFIETDTIEIDVKPESKTSLFIFRGHK